MSSMMNPQGDKFIGDNVVLTDTLREGTVDNLLIVLESGGRIAASKGRRAGELTILDNAIYSPCPVTTETGCPRNPSWAITATRVTYDPEGRAGPFPGRTNADLRRHLAAASGLQPGNRR